MSELRVGAWVAWERRRLPEEGVVVAIKDGYVVAEGKRCTIVMPLADAKVIVPSVEKAKPTRSKRYLDHVRAHACARCHAPPRSEAHHYGPRGLGQKCSDMLTVPLCRSCHQWVEDGGEKSMEVDLLRAQVALLVEWIGA